MRALSSADFLNLWECGFRMHPVDQGLLALSAAFPETPQEALAAWPLGRRNQALAELRCSCFGAKLEGAVPCPQCGQELEFQMDARALAADTGPPATEPVVVRGRAFRLPTSSDVARAAAERDTRAAVLKMLQACSLDGGDASEWQDGEIEEIGERLASADPMAETRLTFLCAVCAHRWEETLDMAAFLWSEVEARARRLLLEIHTLASAYGWTEDQILSVSDRRRAFYLDMVQA
ncbi:MAG TPA: hypothetical protein VGH38_03205 [Bryobacteraceae bacterium]|jgi:hypothetical protein